jgi:hypothetical protein
MIFNIIFYNIFCLSLLITNVNCLILRIVWRMPRIKKKQKLQIWKANVQT